MSYLINRYRPAFIVGLSLLSGLILYAFVIPPKPITVYLAGDSTLSVKEVKAYPETGWGMPFANFFDATVTVDNRAKNGRSTKTFITEGLWDSITKNLKADDYVLIQFGHNDEVKTKGSYATEEEFKANLTRFVNETRAKNAKPVLITPVARRKFDATGNVTETHAVYSKIVTNLAKELNVPLIDLDAKSMELLQSLGPEKSKFLFDYLEPGEHPNYPEGKADDTHFNELGARKMAELVLAQIKELKLDLADRIVVRPVKSR